MEAPETRVCSSRFRRKLIAESNNNNDRNKSLSIAIIVNGRGYDT